MEPVPGDEDGNGEDQDGQYDVEKVDTFEPDEVNVKPTKVVHRTVAASASTPTKSRTKKPTTKDKGKGKAKAESAEAPTVTVRRPKGKMYALPTPSVHHRHRAVFLYSREGRTERLTVRPSLFEPASLTLTSSFTERPIVSDRVNKAWGFNISMLGTVLYGTWLKTGDGTRKPLLRGTTPILRRSVDHGFILIYVFKMGGRS